MTYDLKEMRKHDWNFGPDELLYSYVGGSYSWADMDEIVRSKSEIEARHVASMLEMTPEDIVLDLGSGFGHVALGLAPHCSKYVCADISPAMMEQCQKFTASFTNVSYEIFDRPHIMGLAKYNFTKIFSNSVFIHMTMFEIVYYMQQAYKLLSKNGILYFNFRDADYLAGGDDGFFNSMTNRWIKDPQESTLMHWNSFQAIRGIAQRNGLELKSMKKGQWGAVSVSFIKYE